MLSESHRPRIVPTVRTGAYGAWSVREGDFPRSGSSEEQLRFLTRYAVLAPSAHNTQPWIFRVEGNQVVLFPDFRRALGVSDPTHRELYVSLGCALANLLIAAAHVGLHATMEEFPSGLTGPVARIAFARGGEETPQNAALFAAIPQRHTNRGAYEPRVVPDDVLQRIRAFGGDPGVRLDVVTQKEKIEALAELTAQSAVESFRSADFRAELSRWVRNNYTRQPDGMPGFAVGVPDLPSLLAPLMVRLPPMAKAEAKKSRVLIAGSPAVVVVSSREDAPPGWVKAGAAFERAWLTAVAAGLRAAPYAGPFEAAELHEAVERLLGITDFRSQALLRLGYGPPDPHPTPRREVTEVLTV